MAKKPNVTGQGRGQGRERPSPGPAPSLARPGEEFSIRELKRLYDADVISVLNDYLDRVEPEAVAGRKRRPPARYRVVRPLPSREGYDALKKEHFTFRLGDLVRGARFALDELGGELRDRFDNMPDNLQGGFKAGQIDEAASA